MATLSVPFHHPLAPAPNGRGGGATTMMAQHSQQLSHQPRSHQSEPSHQQVTMMMVPVPPRPSAAGRAQLQQVALAAAGATPPQYQQQHGQRQHPPKNNSNGVRGQRQDLSTATVAPQPSPHLPALGPMATLPLSVMQQHYQQQRQQHQQQQQRFVASAGGGNANGMAPQQHRQQHQQGRQQHPGGVVGMGMMPDSPTPPRAAAFPVVIHGNNHGQDASSGPTCISPPHATNPCPDVTHGGHQAYPQQQQQHYRLSQSQPPRKKARGLTSAEAAVFLSSLDHQLQAHQPPLANHHNHNNNDDDDDDDDDDASFTDDFAELDRLFEADLYSGCLGGLGLGLVGSTTKANVGGGGGQHSGPPPTAATPNQSHVPSSPNASGGGDHPHPSSPPATSSMIITTTATAIDGAPPDTTPHPPVALVDHPRRSGLSNPRVRDADAAAGAASASSPPSNSVQSGGCGSRRGGGGARVGRKPGSPSGKRYRVVPTLGSALPPSSPSCCGADREAGQRQEGAGADMCKSHPSKKAAAGWPKESPLEYLNRSLVDRGYPKPVKRNYTDLGYDRRPSPLQMASFGTRLVRAVQASDAPLLSRLLRSGLSPNPCNPFGDSVVNTVCKRGQFDMLKCLVGNGATLRTADGFGRTPLHHAAWAGSLTSFESVGLVLDEEVGLLFVSDRHGKTPLEYVSRGMWSAWIDFLGGRMDRHWPRGGAAARARQERRRSMGSSIVKDGVVGHEEVMEDPPSALPADVAARVANGTMDPEDAAKLDTRADSDNNETTQKNMPFMPRNLIHAPTPTTTRRVGRICLSA